MAIVCMLLGIGLAIVAWNTRNDVDRVLPVFLLICALGNLGAATHMVATDFKYAFKLAPNEHNR